NIAPGGTLNLNSFAGNALASVIKWSLSSKWNRAWLTCSSLGVSPFHVLTANGALITSTEAANGLVNKAVLRSWLTGLADNAQITVTAEVEYSGNTNKENAVEFPSTTYTVAAPKLEIDTSLLTLSAVSIHNGYGTQQQDYPGKTATRTARGGRPPYRYSRTGVAFDINASTGKVTGHTNGSGVVTVTDQDGRTASYSVAVSNCWQIEIGHRFGTGHDAFAQVVIPPNYEISPAEWSAIYAAYGNVPIYWQVPYDEAWTTAAINNGTSLAYSKRTGQRRYVALQGVIGVDCIYKYAR
ncbi:hypothetical protein SO486_12015, partial [Pseudomonas salmasensis]|nr:hypothetical protein [Pseudomonas salmasensis]